MSKTEASNPLSYSATGVNYEAMDPFKRHAAARAIETSKNLKKHHFSEVSESRGESAFVWREGKKYKASTIEGLGTKNLIADKMYELTGKSYYRQVAQDTVAMMVNDIITVGARPVVVSAYFAAGKSSWFEGEHSRELIEGWGDAVDKVGATWGGGESPTLKGIIYDETVDLAGSVYGRIKNKKQLVLGKKLQPYDQIVTIESSGIHANGLTLGRAVAEKLPNGYLTKLKDGRTFGEALLTPTHLYPPLVQAAFKAGIDIHYMANITGHGLRKIMRADRVDLAYIMDRTNPPQEEFELIQKYSGNSDEEMYGNFNMGTGFAFFVDEKDVKKLKEISSEKFGMHAIHAGFVEPGKKKVALNHVGIQFWGDSLKVR